jgi:hypothetical protein
VNNFYEKTIYNTENNCRIADFPVGHLRTGTPRRMQNPRILNKLSKDSTIQGSYKRPTLEGKKDFSWYAFCFTVDAEPTKGGFNCAPRVRREQSIRLLYVAV